MHTAQCTPLLVVVAIQQSIKNFFNGSDLKSLDTKARLLPGSNENISAASKKGIKPFSTYRELVFLDQSASFLLYFPTSLQNALNTTVVENK